MFKDSLAAKLVLHNARAGSTTTSQPALLMTGTVGSGIATRGSQSHPPILPEFCPPRPRDKATSGAKASSFYAWLGALALLYPPVLLLVLTA